MSPLFFTSCSTELSVALFLIELRWPIAYFLFISVFLFLFLHILNSWTWELIEYKLNTLDNMDTETIPAFRFRLNWLFSCLCFTRRGWLCDFPLKQPRVAFELSYLMIELFHIGIPVVRTGGRTVTWLPKFLGWVDYHIFLEMGLRLRASERVELL